MSNVRHRALAPTVIALFFTMGCAHRSVPVASDPAMCTYDRCALWRASARFLRGLDGELIATEQPFAPVLMDRYLTGNDSAVALAQEYRSLHVRSTVARVVGVPIVIFGSGITMLGAGAGATSSGPFLAVAAITTLGWGLLFQAASLRQRAGERIGRAMLLYNRHLPRVQAIPDSGPSSLVRRRRD
jgi:hypothetical protein